MSDSESSSEDEVEATDMLEEITIDSLKGRWMHKNGIYLNVRGADAEFDGGDSYALTQVGNSVEIDGWKAVVDKSTANKVIWAKEGESTSHWLFEGDIEEAGELDEEVSKDNIVTGKRRRAGVDYAALNKKLDEEEGKEEDDDEDAEITEKKRKKARLDDLARSSSSSSYNSFRSEKKVASTKPAVMKQLSAEELTRIRTELGTEGSMKSADEVLPLVKKLECHGAMTVDILKATKIGVAANRYRKHPNSAVAARFSDVVKSWKKLLAK